MSTLIKNTTLINEGLRCPNTSILIEGDRIKAIYKSGEELPYADKVLDASRLLCLPGVIDDQVHFREPGLTHKGDIWSESRAAVLGGVTSYMEMPNTKPQTITIEAWEDKMQRGEEKSYANYSFYFGATNDNAQLLPKIDLRHTPGIKVFMGASTGNMLVDDEATLKTIFKTSPLLIATHCESEEIIKANKERIIKEYGDDPDVKYHPIIRSAEACYDSSSKAAQLARNNNAKLHILHLSTEKELELLDAKAHITGEVCVHHLWFTDEDYERLGTRIKWNPAIKTKADRDALRVAVANGTLNIIATDHAPHLLCEKMGGALKATSGGPLIQHSLLMMMELSDEHHFSPERVVECMCHNPARLFEVENRGFVRPDYFADLVLIQPNAPWTVSQNNIESKCGWSPLEGHTFNNRIVTTFVNGREVVHNGKIVEESLGAARPLTFNHKEWR